eukprot:TRINITY_DN623_c0_g3_i3.p1 TRINITY_DN623_c0_g3~~TRINITY_DN623_c0_g3_i3.p1  ORF type:complete len:472 (-),score=89.25 TRINITY_DN623_c0_g3_i3:142-1557(-)
MQTKKRVCIVGAGAAGCAAAWALNRAGDRFEVDVWEACAQAGGVATSENIGSEKEPLLINDGVQGGSPTYRNTLLLLNELAMSVHEIEMKISFGKDSTSWNNYGATPFVERLKSDIERFGKVLKWVYRLEYLFILIPISLLLRVLRFSNDFIYGMVLPLTALFFGTGNQTPRVSSAIFARVFLDDELRLFDYDSSLLLSQSPKMFTFPPLSKIYTQLVKSCGGVNFHFGRRVVALQRTGDNVLVSDESGIPEQYDYIIFACDAESVLKILDEDAGFMERKVLGNVQYFNDITVTHEDLGYMQRHYDIDLDRNDQYFVRVDPEDPGKIEMSFNLSNYQAELANSERTIFQTIFLDDKFKSSWTIDGINPQKVLLKKWWRQFAHTWRHYALTVPFMRFLQGKRHTFFCGSYTLVNTHEIAIISGLAAAFRLGAPYPFDHDHLAAKQFNTYLRYIHGISRSTPKANAVHPYQSK